MNSQKGFIAISAVVFSISMLGLHTYKLSTERAAKAHRIELLEDEVRDFGILKTYLMEQVDSLQRAYQALAKKNRDILDSSSEAMQQKLAEKAAIIKSLENNNSSNKDVSILKSKVDDLLKLKAMLERDIADLDSARAQNR